MNLHAVILIALLQQPVPPSSPDTPKRVTRFELVAATDQTVCYIDPQTISTIEPAFYGFNELQVPRGPLAPVKGVVPLYALTLIQVRCATSEAEQVISIFYGSDGQELGQALVAEPYQHVAPDSFRGAEAAFVCGTTHKGAASVPPGVSMLNIARTITAFWAAHPPKE